MGRLRFALVVLGVSSGAVQAKAEFFRRPPAQLDLAEIDAAGRRELQVRCSNPFSCAREVMPLRAQPWRPWLAGASVAVDPKSGEVWVADAENQSIAVSDAAGKTVLRVIPLGAVPEAIAIGPDGRAFVTLRGTGELARLRGARIEARVRVGAEPFGVALSPDGARVFVTLARDAAVVALDAETLTERFRRPVDAEPRGLALTPEGDKLFVSHLTGRGVSVLELGVQGSPKVRTIALPGMSEDFAQRVAGHTGRVSNLTFALALSPGGRRLYVPHVLEDTGADIEPAARFGGYGAGASQPIVATVTAVDAESEELTVPSDANQRGSFSFNLFGMSQPRAAVTDPRRSRLFVAGMGSDDVQVLSTLAADPCSAPLEQVRLPRGSGPKGLAVSADGNRLYVHGGLSHKLFVVDISKNRGLPTMARLVIGDEKLPPEAVHGRQLFFSAHDARISAGGTLACASCHPEGRQDGLTWRLDKGPRQTPSLAGRLVGTAPYNWLGSKGTLKDNMKETMGRLGGIGLPAKDLADLELFMTRYLDAGVPARAPTTLAERGRHLFESDDVGCAHCHAPGSRFTDGKNHDVGTTTGEEIARTLAEQGKAPPPEPKLAALGRELVRTVTTTGLLRALGGNLVPSPEEQQQALFAVLQAVRPEPQLFGNAFIGLRGLGRITTATVAKKKRPEKTPLRLAYNTPSLVGVGGTGPYFHDGSARTLREVLTVGNPGDRMGRTSQLSPTDVDALVAYLETL